MVKYHGARLTSTYAAIADPTRRAILRRLAGGEASISELAAPFEMTLPAISKHLRVLEDAGLLARRKEGRSWHCRLVAGPLQDAKQWLDFYEKFWTSQIDSANSYLRELQQQAPKPAAKAAVTTNRTRKKK